MLRSRVTAACFTWPSVVATVAGTFAATRLPDLRSGLGSGMGGEANTLGRFRKTLVLHKASGYPSVGNLGFHDAELGND